MSADPDPEGDVVRRAMRDLREGWAIISDINKSQRKYWESIAGADLTSAMLANRHEAERCLDHADLAIRRVALSILVGPWKLRGVELRTQAVERLWRDLAGSDATEAMLRSADAARRYLKDSDPNVRAAAASISAYYWGIYWIP